jgi:hypothetical protein
MTIRMRIIRKGPTWFASLLGDIPSSSDRLIKTTLGPCLNDTSRLESRGDNWRRSCKRPYCGPRSALSAAYMDSTRLTRHSCDRRHKIHMGARVILGAL